MKLQAYVDGSIIGNGQESNTGAWAALIIASGGAGGRQRIIRGHEYDTTNNRMELQAAIEALGFPRGIADITLYSDSEYVIKGFTEGRVEKWAVDNWTRKKKGPGSKPGERTPIPNADLWESLSSLAAYHRVQWVHVKGHVTRAEREANPHHRHQEICHQWAFSEATLAERVRSRGLWGMPFPDALESRYALIEDIRRLADPPDPPKNDPIECWGVFRRAGVDDDSPSKLVFMPVSPSEYDDGGKWQCEKAARVMNRTDDTKAARKFQSRGVPQYVVKRVSGDVSGKEDSGTTAA